MKRFLALLLCVVLCASLIPAAAAEEIDIIDYEDTRLDIVDDLSDAEALEPDLESSAIAASAQVNTYDAVPVGYTAINDAVDLWMIRNNMGGKYILTADIDLGAAIAYGGDLYNANGWLALGYNSTVSQIEAFTGILDGNGCTIKGMKCTGPAAALIASNEGTIKNLSITGSIEAKANVAAGLVMYNRGTIDNCHSAVSISLTNTTGMKAAGIASVNYTGAVIQNCSNTASITINCSSDAYGVLSAAGIASMNYGTIDRVWNKGNITTTGAAHYISGNPGTYSYGCFAGGIVGETYPGDSDQPTLTNAYNNGNISAQNSAEQYNRLANAGGIIGYYYSKKTSHILSCCYNTGMISATSANSSQAHAGAIAGSASEKHTTYCYYLNNMDQGLGYSTTWDPCTSVSSALMKRQSTFNGFDFDNVWTMGSGSYLYPVLRHIHTLWHVAAVEPDCTHTGNIEYWLCKSCGRFYSDAAAGNEIAESETILPISHHFEDTVIAPTCTEQGYTTHVCSVCGYSYADTYTDPLGHTGGDPVRENIVEPGCKEDGCCDLVVYCTVCGEELSRTQESIAALDHDWGEPTYTWTEDYSTVTACRVCSRDASHQDSETAETTYEVITEPTVRSEGLGRYTATFRSASFGPQTRDVPIDKLPGYAITVSNLTRNSAFTSLDSEELFNGEASFTVGSAGDMGVLVAVQDGDNYTVLPCTTDEQGIHHFSVSVKENITLVFVFKGDVNLDGRVNLKDSLQIKKHLAGTDNITDRIGQLAADVDGSGTIKLKDSLAVKKSIAGTEEIPW